MSKVKIADIVADISCADGAFFERRFREYQYSGTEQAALTLRSFVVDTIEIPTGGVTEVVKEHLRLVTYPDGRICRYTVQLSDGEVLQAIFFDKNYEKVDIYLSRGRENAYLSLTDYEYILTGLTFSDKLTREGGLIMHGSSIAYRGEGVIFTANSGTGKSTHAGLWQQRFLNEVAVINDDKPALRFEDDVPYVFGTPWSGKTELNHNISAPLKAIVVIEQAPKNALRPLTVSETMYHLSGQTIRPYYDTENGIRALDMVARLAETIPCYLLQCTISEEAVSLVHHTLFGEE